VPLSRAEEARAALIELFPEGFEEAARGGEVELAVYTDSEGEERLRLALGPGEAVPVAAGWEDAWREFHRPVRIGPLWVGPPWERPDAGALPVVIDPGRAFGTGGHQTTRLCLSLLLERPRTSLLDLGCGSGVLAIAAARLGFARVIALDSDAAAVEATRRNAAANGVRVHARQADVLHDVIPEAGLAVANIALPIVERLAPRVPAGSLIASGYFAAARPRLSDWEAVERREAEGWAADLFARGRPGPAAGVG
jgi:ribosomal protein L11 methyltransferase